MSQSFSYHLGKVFGGLPRWARLVVVGLVVLLLYKMCDSSPSTTASTSEQSRAASTSAKAASTPLELAAAELAKQRDTCQSSRVDKNASYAAHMKERRYWDAALAVRECARILADPELVALVKDAEVKSHVAEINSAKTPLRDKVRAIEILIRDYPDVGAKYQADIPKLIAAAEKQEAAAEAKRKRSEGVRIGMSKADVLASSWGKPEQINRTTNVRGTREQWVYGSRGYLYFEDEVLVSIQN